MDNILEQAKELATALTLAHVGNVTEMAHTDTVEIIEERIGDDIDLMAGVVRILATTSALLAGQLAEEWRPGASSAQLHDTTSQIIRKGIGGLGGTVTAIDR